MIPLNFRSGCRGLFFVRQILAGTGIAPSLPQSPLLEKET